MYRSKVLYSVLIIGLSLLLISGCGGSAKNTVESEQEEEATTIPHVLTGRDNCLGCHDLSTNIPMPSDHQGRTSDQCLDCHELASNPSMTSGPGIPHTIEGRANCLGCHKEGGEPELPSSHRGRTSDVCLACHQPG